MRFKVECIILSDSGEKMELFHAFVDAQNHGEAVENGQREYAATHPDSPVPPPEYTWFSYGTYEEENKG